MPGLLGPVKCPFCGHVLEEPYRNLVAKYRHPSSRSKYLAVYRCPRCGKRFTVARRRLKVVIDDEDVRFTLIFRPVEEKLEIYLERFKPGE